MPSNIQKIRTIRTAGFDVGGTKMASAFLDGGALDGIEVEPTPTTSDELIALIVRRVRSIGSVKAVGVGVPGLIDLNNGMPLVSTNLSAMNGVPLREALEDQLQLPVVVGNDSSMTALSEAFDDQLRVRHSVVVGVTTGTGVGGGVVREGELLSGSRSSAFEFGHMIVAGDTALKASAPVDSAPHPASWEALASGTALNAVAIDFGFENGRELVDAGLAGDRDAIGVIRGFGARVGLGLATLMMIFEPDVIAIGGGVSRAGELIREPAEEAARNLMPVPGYVNHTVVRIAEHGELSGLRGAAILPLTTDARA